MSNCVPPSPYNLNYFFKKLPIEKPCRTKPARLHAESITTNHTVTQQTAKGAIAPMMPDAWNPCVDPRAPTPLKHTKTTRQKGLHYHVKARKILPELRNKSMVYRKQHSGMPCMHAFQPVMLL